MQIQLRTHKQRLCPPPLCQLPPYALYWRFILGGLLQGLLEPTLIL